MFNIKGVQGELISGGGDCSPMVLTPPQAQRREAAELKVREAEAGCGFRIEGHVWFRI